MKNLLKLRIIWVIIFTLINLNTRALDVSGHITTNTTWSGGINVVGDIIIDNGVKLTILPGTIIYFTGPYWFNVQGSVYAVSNEGNLIMFASYQNPDGWSGVRFWDTPATNDSSLFIHCYITGGKLNNIAYGNYRKI
ncbi:MAG: hypothetical protein K8R58_11880 [Bacteroidales bacterium]|nr:hypothetical protein [Bacteroidales bacterium]